MEKNLNFRALALAFTATFAASSLNATELSFVARNKKMIIAGAAMLVTTAGLAYYFRANLSTFVNKLLAKKEVAPVIEVKPVIEEAVALSPWDKFKNFFKSNDASIVSTELHGSDVK